MKTKEELNTLRNEVETVNRKLAELTEEELNQVIGGTVSGFIPMEDGGKDIFVHWTPLGFPPSPEQLI